MRYLHITTLPAGIYASEVHINKVFTCQVDWRWSRSTRQTILTFIIPKVNVWYTLFHYRNYWAYSFYARYGLLSWLDS